MQVEINEDAIRKMLLKSIDDVRTENNYHERRYLLGLIHLCDNINLYESDKHLFDLTRTARYTLFGKAGIGQYE